MSDNSSVDVDELHRALEAAKQEIAELVEENIILRQALAMHGDQRDLKDVPT